MVYVEWHLLPLNVSLYMFPLTYRQDGREHIVIDHVLSQAERLKGQPEAILAAIDEWSEQNKILMTIGSKAERGGRVMEVISERKPDVMVELGGYIGYSAIKFGSAVRNAGGARYISLESNAQYAEHARAMIALAGLEGFVEVIVGPCAESMPKLAEQGLTFDLLFIDHDERLYASDLALAEKLRLVKTGSWVLTDNVCGSWAREFREAMAPPENTCFGLNNAQTYETTIYYYELQTGKVVSASPFACRISTLTLEFRMGSWFPTVFKSFDCGNTIDL